MPDRATKFIFVTGGVLSSLGKGLASASIGALLEARGLRVSFLKLDPYLNVDPGTMNPFQHGEVYVTDDGAEADLDLGHYERFTSATMGKINNVTAGKVYETVINKERQGEYLGGTVQVIPHVTDEIKRRIRLAAAGVDLLMVEVGGTVGDIESLPFLEAIRQFRADVGRENVCYMHIALVPYVATAGELKTKPVQHSVKELRAVGISPDVILCRTDRFLSRAVKQKIALFCNVDDDAVITAKDVESIYEVPLLLHDEGVDEKITKLLNIWTGRPNLEKWQRLVEAVKNPERTVRIAMVGKYVDLTESYKSLNEALHHAGFAHKTRVAIEYIDSEKLVDPAPLAGVDGILVPHGFGSRGVEGKIVAVRYAREHRIPYFGICYGMQAAVVDVARNLAGLAGANSTENDRNTAHPVIGLITEWRTQAGDVERRSEDSDLGGTMRLGLQEQRVKPGTRARELYGKDVVGERHRHRYEFNNRYRAQLEDAGMVIAAKSADDTLVEMIEMPNHPWFIACQAHPEFLSTPRSGHPLFIGFVRAAREHKAGGRLLREAKA